MISGHNIIYMPMDIVVYSENSLYGLIRRIKDPLCKNIFDTKWPVKVGLVIKIYEIFFVVDPSKKHLLVPLSSIEDRIVSVYRDNILIDSGSSYLITREIIGMLAVVESNEELFIRKMAKSDNMGVMSAMFITLAMFNAVSIRGNPTENTRSIDSFISNFGNYHKLSIM